jgi:hypothetical protein
VEGESTATILEIDRFRIADEKCDGIANFAGVAGGGREKTPMMESGAYV